MSPSETHGTHLHHALALRRATPGAQPGLIKDNPDAPDATVRVIASSPDAFEETVLGPDLDVDRFLSNYPVTWIDVDRSDDGQVVERLGKRFNIHPLVLEDITSPHQRAKVEVYAEHVFIVLRMVTSNPLRTEQISMVLGKGYIITWQEQPGDCLEPVRDRLRNARGRIRQHGSDYLAYAILDAIVDHFFPVLESLGDELELLEEEVLDNPKPDMLIKLRQTRRDLIALRRAAWPLREALAGLSREENPYFSTDTRTFLRDVYDHSVQAIDVIETFRELAGGLVDLYMSSVSNRMNDIMKLLTIITTIFVPLGFIAGLYGMNFNTASPWNMPELGWHYGYPFALLLMASISGGLLWFFRRKGWL